MKKRKIKESNGNTFYIKGKGIPMGCKFCLEGAKAVLFLNGFCQKPNHCSWYCPISKERKDKSTTFIDEIQVLSKEDIFDEIENINAKGISITGGEPLSKSNLEKTLTYIKLLKSEKGKNFHIHLYTNGINFNNQIAEQLAEAGLDEIRFHPPKNKLNNIRYAINKGMSVGIEVPVIPTKEYIDYLKYVISFLEEIGADFINLNEFEFCFPNSQSLKEKGFELEEGSIASVKNSKNFAMELLDDINKKTSIKIHFCTIRAKDYYQLKNRYLRRAKSVHYPYEVITHDGLLLFGQIEANMQDLSSLKLKLLSNFKIPSKMISFELDKIKLHPEIILKDEFIDFLEEHQLSGFIIEMIPFRGKYAQITEKTPLRIFKQEIGHFS